MKLPVGIRPRGNKLQMRIKREAWEWEATGLDVSQVETAAKLRQQTQAIIDTGSKEVARPGRGTVRGFAEQWLANRTNLSADDDKSRLRKHVIGHTLETGRIFGDLLMGDVRPIHARAIIRAVRARDLAPRTVLNVNSIAKQMFDDAVADEVITHSPWVVPRKELPKKRDKDPKFRATALFTKDELQALLFAADDVAPHDRRTFWALMYLAGLRFGEAASLRWEDRQTFASLPALHVHGSFSTRRRIAGATKTESVRMMPEHPTLTAVLDDWRDHGFEEYFGRKPTAGDLIVPSRMGVHRSKNHSLQKLHEDLGRLKLRARRQHDLRRSFVSHAVDDGAERDRLAPVTHGRGSSVMEMYDTAEWKTCREHVLRLKFDPPASLMGTPWGEKPKEAQMAEADTNRGGGAGNRIRAPLDDCSAQDDGNSATSTRDYRRRSVLFGPVQVLGVLNIPKAVGILLDACGGDADAAIEAIRVATRKRSSS